MHSQSFTDADQGGGGGGVKARCAAAAQMKPGGPGCSGQCQEVHPQTGIYFPREGLLHSPSTAHNYRCHICSAFCLTAILMLGDSAKIGCSTDLMF